MDKTCVDCGKPSMGVRCRKCNGAHIAREALLATATADAALLDDVVGGLTAERLAVRANISRQAATNRIRNAKRRTLARHGV